MSMVATPRPPAGTLLGETTPATVIVNEGVTDSTVMVCDAVCVVEPPVPVMVTVNAPASTPGVVMVTEAPVGGVTVVGLTWQVGRVTPVSSEVTWQLRLTEPVKPFRGEIVRFEEVFPPGSTAAGLKGAICREKSCA